MKYCPKCGAQAEDNMRFCMNCGSPLSEAPSETPAAEAPVVDAPAAEIPAAEIPAAEAPAAEAPAAAAPAVEAAADTPAEAPAEAPAPEVQRFEAPAEQPVQQNTYAQPNTFVPQPEYNQPNYNQQSYQQNYNPGFNQQNTAPEEPEKKKKKKSDIPAEYKPVSAGLYMLLDILFGIPVINFILIIILSVVPQRKSLKNYALSKLLWIIIGVVLSIVSVILIFVFFKESFGDIEAVFSDPDKLQELINNLKQ